MTALALQDEGDDVANIFEKAKRAGAVQGTSEDLQQPGKAKNGAFAGSGRTLAGGSGSQVRQQTPLILALHTAAYLFGVSRCFRWEKVQRFGISVHAPTTCSLLSFM